MSNMSFSMVPGMHVIIRLKHVLEAGAMCYGTLPETGEIQDGENVHTLVSGFYLENEEVGRIEDATEADNIPAIKYIHEKPFPNVIYFNDSRGNIRTITIVYVPLHDHSSIAQGGPAYGTYYTDYTEEETS